MTKDCERVPLFNQYKAGTLVNKLAALLLPMWHVASSKIKSTKQMVFSRMLLSLKDLGHVVGPAY